MPTVFLRISQLCNLFNSILHYFFPKRLRSLFFITRAASSGFSKSLVAVDPKQQSSSCSCSSSPSSSSSSSSSLSVVPLSSSPSRSSTEQQPTMEDAELKRVFQMFDRNEDGRITRRELSESLENLGIFVSDEDLGQMIEKIDVNGDGCVDMEEFGALYQTIMEARDEEEEEGMKEAFNVFDQNGDGFITGEELREVLCSLGLKQGKTVEDCRKMIGMVDVDGDGMVNYNEFKQMMRGTGFAA